MNLVGAHEIAERLAVSRQRVHQLARLDTFPKPAAELRMGKVWRTSDINRWASKHR